MFYKNSREKILEIVKRTVRYDAEEKKVMSKDKDLGRLMGNEKAVL